MAKRLDLPNDRWIDIKEKLNVRNRRDVNTYSDLMFTSDGESVKLNFYKSRIGTAAVRILNWSDGMLDENGQAVRWKPNASFDERVGVIERLDEDVLVQINNALSEFEEAQAAASVKEKNETPDGVTS